MGASARPSPPGPIGGIGLDLERHDALDRFDGAALSALLERWCTPDERRWCLARPHPARAAVELLCCKEAVYKAARPSPSSIADIAVRPPDAPTGRAIHTSSATYGPGGTATVAWTARGAEIAAVAVVMRGDHPAGAVHAARLAAALLRDLHPAPAPPRHPVAPSPARSGPVNVIGRTHRACYMHQRDAT